MNWHSCLWKPASASWERFEDIRHWRLNTRSKHQWRNREEEASVSSRSDTALKYYHLIKLFLIKQLPLCGHITVDVCSYVTVNLTWMNIADIMKTLQLQAKQKTKKQTRRLTLRGFWTMTPWCLHLLLINFKLYCWARNLPDELSHVGIVSICMTGTVGCLGCQFQLKLQVYLDCTGNLQV